MLRWKHRRRRTLLILIGLIWVLQGWTHLHSQANWQFGRFGPGPLDDLITNHWSGLLWVVCGLTGIAAGLLPSRVRDTFGFNALLIPPMLWVCLSGWSWVIFVASRGEYGSPRMWVQAVMWSLAVVVLLITSGWPDPDDRKDT